MKIAINVNNILSSKQYKNPNFSGIDRVITEEFERFHYSPDVELELFINYNNEFQHITEKNKFPTYKSLLEYCDVVYFTDVLGLFDERYESRKAKIFVMVHDLVPIIFPKQGKNLLRTNVLKKILRRGYDIDHFFCVSESTKKDLCSLGKFDPCDVTVAKLAASTRSFYPCKNPNRISFLKHTFGIPKDGKYLLVMSPLNLRKNLPLLFRSFFDLLDKEGIEDLYLLIGTSQKHTNDKKAVEVFLEHKYNQKIIFTQHVPEDHLSALYSGALALVFPSLYEGFGIPPLEAMQCGTPVITSNTSSLPEVVGDAGIMLDPKDRKGLTKSILKLYRNEELRQELGKKGIERAKLFSWKKHCNIMLETFCKVTNIPKLKII